MLTILACILTLIPIFYLIMRKLIMRKARSDKSRWPPAIFLSVVFGTVIGFSIIFYVPVAEGTYSLVEQQPEPIEQVYINGTLHYAKLYQEAHDGRLLSVLETLSPSSFDYSATTTRTGTFYSRRLKPGFWYTANWPFVQFPNCGDKPKLHLRKGDPTPPR